MYDRQAQLDCWRNPQGSSTPLAKHTMLFCFHYASPISTVVFHSSPARGNLEWVSKDRPARLTPMRWQLQTFICQILISNLYLWKSVLMLLLLDPTNQIQKASKLFEHLKHSPDELTRKPPNRKIRQKICKQVLSAGSTWAHRGAIVRSLLAADGLAIWRRMFKTN